MKSRTTLPEAHISLSQMLPLILRAAFVLHLVIMAVNMGLMLVLSWIPSYLELRQIPSWRDFPCTEYVLYSGVVE